MFNYTFASCALLNQRVVFASSSTEPVKTASGVLAAPALRLFAAAFNQGVCAVRKYRMWTGSTPKGPNGYGVLFAPALARGHRAPRVRPVARGRSRLDAAARQRRVLAVMMGALAVAAAIGLATGSSAAWWVFVALLPVVCVYLAILFRTRRLMAEREMNLAFLGSVNRGGYSPDDAFSLRDDEPLERVVGISAYR